MRHKKSRIKKDVMMSYFFLALALALALSLSLSLSLILFPVRKHSRVRVDRVARAYTYYTT